MSGAEGTTDIAALRQRAARDAKLPFESREPKISEG
jgi:hypothetical protein